MISHQTKRVISIVFTLIGWIIFAKVAQSEDRMAVLLAGAAMGIPFLAMIWLTLVRKEEVRAEEALERQRRLERAVKRRDRRWRREVTEGKTRFVFKRAVGYSAAICLMTAYGFSPDAEQWIAVVVFSSIAGALWGSATWTMNSLEIDLDSSLDSKSDHS